MSGGGQERGPIRIAWCDTRGSDRHEIANESESGEGEAEPAALIVRQLIPHRGVGDEQASQRRRQEVVGLSRSQQATGVAKGDRHDLAEQIRVDGDREVERWP